MCCNGGHHLNLRLRQVANNFHIERCQDGLDNNLDEYPRCLAGYRCCANKFVCVAECKRRLSPVRDVPVSADQPAVAHECTWRALWMEGNRACRVHGSS